MDYTIDDTERRIELKRALRANGIPFSIEAPTTELELLNAQYDW